MVVAETGMRIHVVDMQLKAHTEEVLASRRGLGGSSSWGCRYCCMGLWLGVYIGPLHWLVKPISPSLKEHLGSALLDAQWIDS